MPIAQKIRELWQETKHFCQTFNLFPSIPPAANDYDLQNQKISTRVYVTLLTIVLIILLIYNSIETITKTITVKTPSLNEYLHLYSKYPQSLTCPCTDISIEYEKFVEVQYSFHQVCTSDFVSEQWINYLSSFPGNVTLTVDDFRWTSSHSFQTLRAFCDLIAKALSDGLDRFYASEFL
ncbi:unnamed protein product, partial [Adineta ricciae]